jgi:hypothetical protein
MSDVTKQNRKENRGGFMVSPRSGAKCPVGAHPGNTGGKPGRSGRPSKQLGAVIAELRAHPELLPAVEELVRRAIAARADGGTARSAQMNAVRNRN